jgi:hypothetical protein
MTKRLACLSAFLMLVLLPSFGFQDAGNAQNGLAAKSQTVSPVPGHKRRLVLAPFRISRR